MKSADHPKTTDFKDHAGWIGKGMAVGTINLGALAGTCQSLFTLSAHDPAFFFGGYGIGLDFIGGLPQRLPFNIGPQGVGRDKIMPKHGRPFRSKSLVNNCRIRYGRLVPPSSARMSPIIADINTKAGD